MRLENLAPRPRLYQAFYTDALGRLWSGREETVIHHTNPTGTDSEFLYPKYVRDPADRPEILTIAGDGGFSWLLYGGYNGFVQYLGTTPADYQDGLIWHDLYNYLSEHVYPPGSGADHVRAQRYETEGVFLGGLDSLEAALVEASLRINDISEFEDDKFFWANRTGTDYGLRVINTFVLGDITRITTYSWRGPWCYYC